MHAGPGRAYTACTALGYGKKIREKKDACIRKKDACIEKKDACILAPTPCAERVA